MLLTDKSLRSDGWDLKDFDSMPIPKDSYVTHLANKLIVDKLNYNRFEQGKEYRRLNDL